MIVYVGIILCEFSKSSKRDVSTQNAATDDSAAFSSPEVINPTMKDASWRFCGDTKKRLAHRITIRLARIERKTELKREFFHPRPRLTVVLNYRDRLKDGPQVW